MTIRGGGRPREEHSQAHPTPPDRDASAKPPGGGYPAGGTTQDRSVVARGDDARYGSGRPNGRYATSAAARYASSPRRRGGRGLVRFILLTGIRIAQEYQRGVVFRLGRFTGLRGPGIYWIIPLGIDRSVTIDIRTRTISAERQETITRAPNVASGSMQTSDGSSSSTSVETKLVRLTSAPSARRARKRNTFEEKRIHLMPGTKRIRRNIDRKSQPK